jgi:hypothetical protein
MQSTIATVAIGVAAAAALLSATRLCRPDLVVTTTEQSTETGHAWDPADIVHSTGIANVQRLNELDWLVTFDDGGHTVTHHPVHPFYASLKRNV